MKSSLALVLAVMGLCVVVPRGNALDCLTCADETNCAAGSPTAACTESDAQSCEIKFGADGKVIQKGCSGQASTPGVTCSADGASCLCNTKDCNSCSDLATCKAQTVGPTAGTGGTPNPDITTTPSSGSLLKPLALISFIIFIALGLLN